MKIGDLVILNQMGIGAVFGDDGAAAYAAGYLNLKPMRITDIDPAPLLEHEGCEVFAVEVDDPFINQFLIDTECFDEVPEVSNEATHT